MTNLKRLFAQAKHIDKYDGTDDDEIVAADEAESRLRGFFGIHGEELVEVMENQEADRRHCIAVMQQLLVLCRHYESGEYGHHRAIIDKCKHLVNVIDGNEARALLAAIEKKAGEA